MHLITSDVVVANTSLAYQFNSEKSTGGMAGYQYITPFTDFPMIDGYGRRVLNPSTGNTTLTVKATMSTSNPDISPMLDTTRYGIIAVENIINNMPLSNASIILTNAGSGYGGNGAVTVTVSAPTGAGGSQAYVAANVVNNSIVSVYVVTPGSGYITTPTITIASNVGSGANIAITGETSPAGGPACRARRSPRCRGR